MAENKKLFTEDKNAKHGFTLIEIVIVLAIFSILVGATINIFISIIQNQKRILAEQQLLNQASYALEVVSKAARMAKKDPTGNCLGAQGYIYLLTHCDGDASQTCSGVKFIDSSDNDACDEFFLDSTNPAKPVLKQMKNGAVAQNLLSDTFTIKYLRFIIDGDKTLRATSENDFIQPKMTMVLDIQDTTVVNPQEKVIQTSISERNLNIKN